MKVVVIFPAYRLRRASRKAARKGDWQAAVQAYRSLVAWGVATSKDMVQLAHCLKEAGDTAAASEAYWAVAAAFPHDVDAQLHHGLFLQQLGRNAEATNALARTLALDPENAFVRTKLAELGVGEDGMDEAMLTGIMAGQDAIRSRVGAVTRLILVWRLRQARRSARAGNWDAAAQQYRWMLSLDPHDPRVLVQLGHVLRKQGDVAQAIAIYRIALIAGPRHPDTYLHLGHALKTLGLRSAALQAYFTAIRLQPDLPSAIAELRAMGWSDADLMNPDRSWGGAKSDAQATLIPPLSRLYMPAGLTRRQRSIWMLLAAQAENGN